MQRNKYNFGGDNSKSPETPANVFVNKAYEDNGDVISDVPNDTEKYATLDQVQVQDPPPDADDKDDAVPENACSRTVATIQTGISNFYDRYKRVFWIGVKLVLLGLYLAYFGYAMYYRFGDEGSWRLLICTALGLLLLLWFIVGDLIMKRLPSCGPWCGQPRGLLVRKIMRWTLYLGIIVFVAVYTGVVIGQDDPRNLVSLSGIAFFILTFYIFSTDPSKVNWHPVFWGLSLQYIFALMVIRTRWGYDAFEWVGDRVTELLSYSDAGAIFVFGDTYKLHQFAFQVLPVIIYFSSLISILYYLGVMQWIIGVIGRFLSFCLETTPAESLNAAGNIFVGQTESPLMIRPFLPIMTKSELHAIMTGGFATVAGSVLGAYVLYGVKANHLLGASVMSAPAALAMSKLIYPETEKPKAMGSDVYKMEKGESRNVIEAASSGASTAIKLVANVAVNVMAFLAILEFFNATLVWFGDRAGVEGLTFQFICSYVFYPLAFLMGVDPQDCRRVGELIGYKTFTNEFVAYIKMGDLLDNGKVFQNYTQTYNQTDWEWRGEDAYLTNWNMTLTKGFLLPRSEMIATYALCGFSNLGSMGIQLGGLGAIAPSRKPDMTGMVLRAMITGNVACFLTACIAGLFYSSG